MSLILRPDLRCPQGCNAAIVELRNQNDIAEYRCKVHGPLLPPVKPIPRINHPNQGAKP